jgi:hypothetical protein
MQQKRGIIPRPILAIGMADKSRKKCLNIQIENQGLGLISSGQWIVMDHRWPLYDL